MLFVRYFLNLLFIKRLVSCEEYNSTMSFSYNDDDVENNNTMSLYYYDDDDDNNNTLSFSYNNDDDDNKFIDKLTSPYLEDHRQIVRSRFTNSVGSIKGFCESETNKYNSEILMNYIGIETTQNCNGLMDAKSYCCCLIYSLIFTPNYGNLSLETFHWTQIDLKCPVRNPIRRNLDYYKLKKKFLRNKSSLYLDDNNITYMCIQNKKIKNSTNKNSSEVQMLCDLYQFYEYKMKHIYHVEYF